MPTTTWATAFRQINQQLGFVQFDTTTNLTTNTNVVSTELADRFAADDYFIGRFVLIRGANNDEVTRRVTDYTASTGTLVVAGANLSAESGATTCELIRFHPDDMKNHFNQAIEEVFPELHAVRETIRVTGQKQFTFTLPTTHRGSPTGIFIGKRDAAESLPENLFTNGGFESWTNSTTAASWTLTGGSSAVTQEQETTGPANYAVLQDGSSAKLVAAASTATTLLQTVTPSVGVEGMEINTSIWVYCLTASRVSAQISGTNVTSTPVTGSTHGGTGWELLTVTATTNSAATTFNSGVDVTSGTVLAMYVDEALCTLGQSEALDREWEPIYNWKWIPPIDGGSNGGLLRFYQELPDKRRLRIDGRGQLSSVSADSDTVEIDGEFLKPLYEKTLQLAALGVQDAAPSDLLYWSSRAKEYGENYEKAVNEGKNMHRRIQAQSPYIGS
jgi:hypothetical protein